MRSLLLGGVFDDLTGALDVLADTGNGVAAGEKYNNSGQSKKDAFHRNVLGRGFD
jgi:hypothetical protein